MVPRCKRRTTVADYPGRRVLTRLPDRYIGKILVDEPVDSGDESRPLIEAAKGALLAKKRALCYMKIKVSSNLAPLVQCRSSARLGAGAVLHEDQGE